RDRWNTKCQRVTRASSALRPERNLTLVSRRNSLPSRTLLFEHALSRRRVLRELFSRPARTRHQLAATVRALALEYSCHARRAERAFERADERLGRVRRQILVAVFAIGA